MLLSKEREVLETISIVKDLLKNCGFNLNLENVINPIKNIWSVHLKDTESQFYTNGKGSTKENAIASAYCEFLERLGTGYFFSDYAIDGLFDNNKWIYSPDEVKVKKSKEFKENILNKKLWSFYDPENLLDYEQLIDSGCCNPEVLITLPFNNSFDNSDTLFPIELLRNLYASNGLSAGNSETETLTQGLSECIERGVKNYIIQECLSLPNISDSYIESLGFLEIKEEIESYGYPLLIKDASLDGRFPVICALLINQNEGTVLSSFGCHPNIKVAIERTLTELLQGRKINSISDFSPLVDNINQVADEANIESHFINSTGVFHFNIIKQIGEKSTLWSYDNQLSDLDYLKLILKKEGYSYYYRAYNIGEMWVSQSIIPKLSEIYPIEDLEYDNKNRSGVVRSFLKNNSLSKTELKSCIKWFNECYIPGSAVILDYLGISCSSNNSLSNLQMDELELCVYIQSNNKKELHNLLSQMDLTYIDKTRIGYWRCLLAKLNKFDEVTLENLYGKENLLNVDKTLKGSIPKDILPDFGLTFNNIQQHKEFSNVYHKYIKLRD
ncbi:MAG: YcaO-like family protein [Spirochaetaceae bacterium]